MVKSYWNQEQKGLLSNTEIIIRAMSTTIWTISLGLQGLLACLVFLTAANPTPSGQQFVPGKDVIIESRARKEQLPATVAPNNNFGIKFVPLFSLIATYIPKILGRFGNFTRTTSIRSNTRKARAIDTVQIDGFYCSPKNFGTWKDPQDCRQFYVCREREEVSENENNKIRRDKETFYKSAQQKIISRGRLSIERHRCILDYVYSENENKCEPEGKAAICDHPQL